MMRGFALALLAGLSACAAACGGAEPAGPPEIRFGIDACDGCGMAIAEARYAAAVIADDGAERRILKFDDIGCLARWEAGAPGPMVRQRWVHDRSTEAWIDANTATFAMVQDLTTPMGSGVAAFSKRSDAVLFLKEHGGVALSWNEMLTTILDKRPHDE